MAAPRPQGRTSATPEGDIRRPPAEGRGSSWGRNSPRATRATVATVTSTFALTGGRFPRRALALDAGLSVLAFAVGLVILFARPDPDLRGPDALGVALVALASLPLVVRRRAPLLVFVLAAAAMVPLHVLDYPGQLGLVPAVAVYSLAAFGGCGSRRKAGDGSGFWQRRGPEGT